MDERQEPSYQVVEIFQSINGEGQRAGERAAFVRMKGCNLACSYCDTSWANELEASFRNMGIGEILDKLSEFHVKNVTVTGGEPLVQKAIVLLLKVLAEAGYRVEVETNGSVPLEPFRNISSEIAFTVDYKLPGSGMEERMLRENFRGLAAKDTVKFVVSDRADLEKAYEVCERELSDCRGGGIFEPGVWKD